MVTVTLNDSSHSSMWCGRYPISTVASCHMTSHMTNGFLRQMGSTCRWVWSALGSAIMCVYLQELWKHALVLDVNRVYTNNIHSMAATYGIEAAATAIVRVSPPYLWL